MARSLPSPHQRVSLLWGLHEDVLRWHASTDDGDPIDGVDLLDSTDVEALDINPAFLVNIAENTSNSLITGTTHTGPRWTPASLVVGPIPCRTRA